MKIWVSRGLNIIIILVIGFAILQRVPDVLYHIKSENQRVPSFKAHLITGEVIDSEAIKANQVLVFWATWCEPCKLELWRINRMIESKEIAAESVIAISSFEDYDLVKRVSFDRGYKFQIGLDPNGQIANQFQITGTPTIVIFGRNLEIKWFTTGLSPLLELNVKRYLSNNPAS